MTAKEPKPELDLLKVAADIAALSGNLSAVAKKHGVTRNAIQKRLRKNKSLRDVLGDAREGMLDSAESALYRAVLDGQAWAVCFFLKTQGKARGYIERPADPPPPPPPAAGSMPIEEAVEYAEFRAAKRLRDVGKSGVPVVPEGGAAVDGVPLGRG